MSRAINLSVTEAEVQAACARHKVPISAIETLASGGTRVVLNTIDDTAIIAKAFRTRILTGAVTRTPTRLR
ncbi:hypothetical protein DBR17_07215 [Sphingomonas sp. HMWF008]|nr:hypothetical protein DBR17_07215 [Sphingomonas sp. HMWF008]